MINTKYKVSVIIKTNRTNKNTSFNDWKKFIEWDNPIIDLDYKELVNKCFEKTTSFIEPTLKSLYYSDFNNNDFEVVIVHRNPESIRNPVKKYIDKLNIKLIKEKQSPWHNVGSNYPTLCNAVNTGVIWSDGKMLISADDCTLFPKDLLSILSKRITMPVGITYSFTNEKNQTINDGWTETKIKNGIAREMYRKEMMRKHIVYGYCFNVTLEQMLALNGFNESLDGAMQEDDGEFAERFGRRFDIDKHPINTKIYMFGHDYKNVNTEGYAVRNNHKWKDMLPDYYRANMSRPSKDLCEKYKNWHIKKYGKIDKNFDVCRKVNTFNLKQLRKSRGWYLYGRRVL
jgi:hypothetical protein